MRDTPNVMPSLHMPLQSGSDALLKAMRRAYRRDRYLAILDNVRAHIPHAAITTDIIVGFPGETEEDFAGHPGRGPPGPVLLRVHLPVLDPRGHPGRDHAGPGAAAGRAGALRPARRPRRADRRPKRTRSRTAPSSRSSSPRARAARTPPRTACRAAPGTTAWCTSPRTTPAPRPGDIVTTRVTSTAPHYLRADDAPLSVRRTRAGDAWEARQLAAEHATAAASGGATAAAPAPVLLGMPARRG